VPQGPSDFRVSYNNNTACDLGLLLHLKAVLSVCHFQDVGLIRAPPCSTIVVFQPESRPLQVQFANSSDTPEFIFSDLLLAPWSLYPLEASLTSLGSLSSFHPKISIVLMIKLLVLNPSLYPTHEKWPSDQVGRRFENRRG
jgi:hypothetical protein